MARERVDDGSGVAPDLAYDRVACSVFRLEYFATVEKELE